MSFLLSRFFKQNNNQIIRFIISGLLATSLNFLVYGYFYSISENIIFASSFGYVTGIIFSFLFAKVWVFRDKSKQKVVKSFFIFCLIYFLGGIETSLIIIFLNTLLIDHKIAWFFGTLVGASNNYLGSKYLLFRD